MRFIILIVLFIINFDRVNADNCIVAFSNHYSRFDISRLTTNERISVSVSRILENQSAVFPGVVVASPEAIYEYEWRRDSALVLSSLINIRHFIIDPQTKGKVDDLLFAHRFVVEHLHNNIDSYSAKLGEPKYHVDLSPFTGEWGRPQNDGPALTAIYLFETTRIPNARLKDNSKSIELAFNELDYLFQNLLKPSFDYWEEVLGQHFHILMVQRKAFILGAQFASSRNDVIRLNKYEQAITLLNFELEKFWDHNSQTILAHRDTPTDLFKTEQLDIATILGVLHGEVSGRSFDVLDPRVTKTVLAIEDVFSEVFPVDPSFGLAIGRYRNDIWNGHERSHYGSGHAWFLANHGLAEFYFRKASALQSQGYIKVDADLISQIYAELVENGNQLRLNIGERLTSGDEKFSFVIRYLKNKGLRFLVRSSLHMSDEGFLSEQFNPVHGSMYGPQHLNWSYASYLTAVVALQKISR